MNTKRICRKCHQELEIEYFQYTPSKFLPAHRAIICTQCLETMIKQDNLDEVDTLMRHLDLPFDADQWANLYETHADHTLSAYFNLLNTDEVYSKDTWKEENTKWALAREQKIIDEKLGVLTEAQRRKLRKDWSTDYSIEELQWLEDFYSQLVATQNVSTPLLQKLARNLCEIQLRIDKGIRSGEDVKKDMDARDNILKMGHFDSTTSKSNLDFDSVGELYVYLEKIGWHPQWHQEPQDSLDFLMKNTQKYLQRLVSGEGTIVDQIDMKREQYNMNARLEEIDDSITFNFEQETPDEYEGEEELAGELSDWTVRNSD